MSALAPYLDEIADDPTEACGIAKSLGITDVCLRQAWGVNVTQMPDPACQVLMGALRANGLNVAMIATDMGSTPTNLLPINRIIRAVVIALYYHARLIRFFAGKSVADQNEQLDTSAWMSRINQACGNDNLVPVLEIIPDSVITSIEDVARAMARFPNWRWMYNPAMLVARQRIDPIAYWAMLHQHASVVVLSDYAIGVGYRPLLQGSCNWRSFDYYHFNGLYVLEHGLGRHYGNARTRTDVFKLALEATRGLPFIGATSAVTT